MQDNGERRISVVIPTTGRATLQRAVDSVIGQDFEVHEIIVVNDSAEELRLMASSLVREIKVGPGAGGNIARQAGIDAATGTIIGMLDDDDEWLPEKLERQLQMLDGLDASRGHWLASTRVEFVRHDGSQLEYPETAFHGRAQGIPANIFYKTSLRAGHGYLQFSTLLFPRELAQDHPLPNLPFHQDIAWLMTLAADLPDMPVVQSPDVLVRYHVTTNSLSSSIKSRLSVRWAADYLSNVDRRAAGDFILTESLSRALSARSVTSAASCIFASFRYGRPGIPAVLYSLGKLAQLIQLRIGRMPMGRRPDL